MDGAHLARRVPLFHHPARVALVDWAGWGALKSRAARGEPLTGSGPVAQIDHAHVFFFAGVSAYRRSDASAIGDSAAAIDERSAAHHGEASPFDSGAVAGERPCVRPWHTQPAHDRWQVLRQRTVDLGRFRDEFGAWLAASYDDPADYLMTAGAHDDGRPTRSDPPELCRDNGTADADRRAWTWEVRIRGEVSLAAMTHVIAPRGALMRARRIGVVGRGVTLVPTDPSIPAGSLAVYRASGELSRGLAA